MAADEFAGVCCCGNDIAAVFMESLAYSQRQFIDLNTRVLFSIYNSIRCRCEYYKKHADRCGEAHRIICYYYNRRTIYIYRILRAVIRDFKKKKRIKIKATIFCASPIFNSRKEI